MQRGNTFVCREQAVHFSLDTLSTTNVIVYHSITVVQQHKVRGGHQNQLIVEKGEFEIH